MEFLALLILVIAYVGVIYVCFEKGKNTLGWLGVIGLIPFLTPLLGWFPLIGAFRLAKPDSKWAHARYGPEQMAEARRRFPERVQSRHSERARVIASGGDLGWDYRDGVVPEGRAVPQAVETLRASTPVDHDIEEFLREAERAGVISTAVRLALVGYAAGRLEARPDESPPPETSPAPVDLSPYGELAQLPPYQPGDAEQLELETPSGSEPTPTARLSSPWAERLRDMGEAVRSDLVLHGFNYLGVLIVFVAVLGFLLFSFVEIPDAQQPLYELAMALIFFGFAWYLRRQGAELVGRGMELVGGMVLPLVVFASLVDNAPFPPDFRDGSLIVALTAAALAMAALYAWITSRWTTSMLRYLVLPLVWLAAMTSGFVFKTDERLFSDAITRLVSWQPALASAAIASSLVVFSGRLRTHHLAPAVFSSALAGVPIAYIMTLSLGIGESWATGGPAVVLGAATFVSVELLAGRFGQAERLAGLRPLLLAGVVVPLVPGLGVPMSGLVATVGYGLLLELTAHRNPDQAITQSLCAMGFSIGAVAALGDPWPAVLSSAVVSFWAHARRHRPGPFAEFRNGLTSVAAVAPVGIGFGIIGMLPGEPGWMVIAGSVTVMALVIRWRRDDDPFWEYWLPAASVLITLGAYDAWQTGAMPWAAIASVFTVSIAVALGRRWRELRVWIVLALASAGLGMTMETLGAGNSAKVASWATLGLALVVTAAVWRRRPAGHLALAGHVMAGAVIAGSFDDWTFAVATVMWTSGWLVTLGVSERGAESAISVLTRATDDYVPAESAQKPTVWVAPLVAAVSLPVAALAMLRLWSEFAAHHSWTGIALSVMALVYVSIALRDRLSRPLRLTLATTAVLLSVGAVPPALTDRVSDIFVSSAVIAVAILGFRSLRWRGLAWVAWTASFLLTVLVADTAGVSGDRLHLVVLGWGALLLSGGLWADDRLRGRRAAGELVRVWWLRSPTGLGVIAVPLGLAPLFFEPPAIHGWWSLAGAVFSLMIALQVRLGAVTYLTYAMASYGIIVLAPWSLIDRPSRLVALAAPLVLISFLAESRQETTSRWARWDIAPLAVAHGVGVIALLLTVPAGDRLSTALVFGGLSVLVGSWKRHMAWIDAGNVLILLSAAEAGHAWLTIALAATALRGALGAHLTTGRKRLHHHVIGVVSAGLAWVSFLGLQPWSMVDRWNISALFWGGLTLAVSALGSFRLVRDDTVRFWGGLGVAAVAVAGMMPVLFGRFETNGPHVGIGVLLVALACELGWRSVDPVLRHLAVLGSGLAWLLVGAGMDWDPSLAATVTAVVFGGLMVTISETNRIRPPTTGETLGMEVAMSWTALAAIGVIAAVGTYAVTLAPGEEGHLVAAGTGLLALGAARGARPLGLDWLRDASGVVLLAALTLIAVASGVPDQVFATSLAVVAVIATYASLAVWTRQPTSVAVRALMVLGAAATVEALGYAIAALPEHTLLVAVVLSAGVQTSGIGLHQDRPGFLAAGPPLIGIAAILTIAAGPVTSPQWYTAVVGLVVLSELEILRKVRSSRGERVDIVTIVLLEWSGLALVALPGLAEMFRSGLGFGLVSFLVAGGVFVWAILTRVRRRAIAAAALALATAILLIFAAAASTAPESASLWIVGAGFGSAVMLVAGLVEAYLSRKGHLMVRIGRLLEDWE